VTDSSNPLRTKLLAMALASFGVASGCGGSSDATPAATESASPRTSATSGSETATTGSASCSGQQTNTPASTETPAAGSAAGDTSCGHGACG